MSELVCWPSHFALMISVRIQGQCYLEAILYSTKLIHFEI